MAESITREELEAQITRAVDLISQRSDQIAVRAMATASRVEGSLTAHLKHHEQLEAQATEDRRELRETIKDFVDELRSGQLRIHQRINQILFAVCGAALVALAYLVLHGVPWHTLAS